MLDNIYIITAVVWLVTGLLEIAASSLAGRLIGKVLAFLSLMFLSALVGIVLGLNVNLLAVLFVVLAAYRGVLVMRVLSNRLHKKYLRKSSLVASLTIMLLQLIILLSGYFYPENLTVTTWLSFLAVAQLVVALVFLYYFTKQLKHTEFRATDNHISDINLPTLTVAIPAKDENIALENCLNSLLACDYPKLEVLVLDDSAGSKTSEIIRSLAHGGVRFILGEQPTQRWLAKNLAYDRLAREANGEIILFCGVDVRFSKQSLRQLVEKMIFSRKQMISLMPLNLQNPKSLVIQPMRYFWELARPRFGVSQPVLSTCWLIKKAVINKAGGFGAVAGSTVSERYFASFCTSNNKSSYGFFRANKQLKLGSTKPHGEQRGTTIRTRYPLLRKRLISVLGLSVFILSMMVAPLALVVLLPIYQVNLLFEVFAVVTIVLWLAIYGTILKKHFNTSWLYSPLFILAALVDVWLTNLSLIKYEFGKVVWKGRDITPSAMKLKQD